MNRYKISSISHASEESLMENVYLVLLNATNAPPHLAVAVHGKLFTLSVKGPKVDSDLRLLLRTIEQRSIESIFVQLNVPKGISADQLSEAIRKSVLSYPRVDVNVATCLAPIKDFCEEVYNIDTEDVNFIYELLPLLETMNAISAYSHLNLENALTGNDFFLEKYSMEDINEEIRKASVMISSEIE